MAEGRSRVADIRPQPGFQEAFCSTPADIAIGGGTAGCGKSWSLIYDPLRWSHVPRFEAIVFRRTKPEVRGGGGIWEESTRLCPLRSGRPRGNSLEWIFPSGARLAFSHLQYTADVQSHRSKQYAFIGFDELTLFDAEQFWYMLSRNRSTCGVKPYVRACTNPDPDSWVRDLIAWWLDPNTGFPLWERSGIVRWLARVDGDEIVWGDSPAELEERHGIDPAHALSFTFVGGRLSDNPKLREVDPRYEARLRALSYVERMRLLEGNWLVRASAGNVFKREWFEVVDAPPMGKQVLRRVRSWDKAATAGKTKEGKAGPAYSVGTLMSITRDKTICVEDVVRLRGSPATVEQAICNTASRDGHGVEVAIWQDPGQAGKADVSVFVRKLQGYTVRGVPAREDKVTYASPLSAQAEQQNVKVVRGNWNREWFDELEGFPDGRYKDQVDSASLGYLRLSVRGNAAHIAPPDADAGYHPSYWDV